MDMAPSRNPKSLSRRRLLQAGLAAGVTLSTWPLARPSESWGAAAGQPKRGGILRVWGYDPPHFDPQLTINGKTQNTVSFVYSTLVQYKVGADVKPSTFTVEPHLAERWEQPDDTTYIFHLRQGVKWHNKPPVNGRELVAEDVKFTFDRFLTEPGNAARYVLEPVDRVEVVDRYTVKFLLKEPFVWLVNVLANPLSMWIIAPEVVEKFGDLKRAEHAIGTGPFLLERYEPNVKTVFKRNPDYFLPGQPYVDSVEWLVVDDASAGLAMYRTGQLDAGPWHWWAVRQQDLEALKKTHPNLMYQDFLSIVSHAIYMRTDQAPFNDVRVRRAISHAIDRQGIIDAVFIRGALTPAVARGLPEWSPRSDELGAGAKYYDIAQLAQDYLKDVGIEAELKPQEYGAYMATTFAGKYEGLAIGPVSLAWEPDSVLYGLYAPDQGRNNGHVNDPKITAMLKEQRRTKDLEARRKMIFDIQRHIAEQQYYVYLYAVGVTGSWQPYVKNYAPNPTFNYGGRAAALWLER